MEKEKPVNYELVVIGGSAGSVNVIIKLLSELPGDFSLPVIIVIHRLAVTGSRLADIFQAKTSIPLKDADEKEKILAGNIYLAPANYHLLIECNKTISLDDSEKVNYSRPSIDVTFEQAAEVYGNKVIGILLTGANLDGATGLLRINQKGGLTIVQNPDTAEIATMPQAAINLTDKHIILNVEEMVPFILQKM